MAAKLLRLGWERQPVGPAGINWGHPRAEGLAFFAPLSAAHGTRDLVAEQLGTRTGLETYLPSQAGAIHHLFGTSNFVDFPEMPASIGGTTPVTFAWTQEPRATSAYSTVLAFTATGVANGFAIFLSSSDPGYHFTAGPRNSGNVANFSSAIGAVTNEVLDRYVLTVSGGVTSNTVSQYTLWRNGVRYTTASATSYSTSTSTGLRVGALQDNSNPWEGLIGDLRMWSRVLSDGEAEAESTLPEAYALYAPQRIWVPSSAIGGSFSATGALTADAATLSGTAAHLTLHPSSGALSAQAATLAGTATHLTLHTSSGALSADAATVAGSAALTSTGSFSAAGSLSADAATLAGTATHLTLHTSTGALAADAATLAGTAAHLTLHTSTGGLSAGSAAVSGVAVHSGPGAVEDTRPQGAGRPRRQVRRVVVEIDGKDFIVNSEEEAIALLDKAKEEAEALAKVQVQRAAKATVRKPRKVIADARKTLAVPTIKAPGLEEYVSKIMDDIRDTYASSMRTIEVAALLRKRDRDEEDDEEILMLIA